MRNKFIICISLLPLLFGCIDAFEPRGPELSSSHLALIEDGRAVAAANCSSCHAIGTSGTSPNPRAPIFRTLLKKYDVETLRTELAEGMRVAHAPMPQFQFRPEAVDALITYLQSIEVKAAGQLLVEDRCAKCHATGISGTSPYPGAQPFRMLGQRWRRDQLHEALVAGIVAEHDNAEARVPPMKLTPKEADAFLGYLDSIATQEHPSPTQPE
jgi:mono/diheme cytochrome c family protein